MFYSRPSQREDFEFAIICALEIEFEAVSFVVDELSDENEDLYGKTAGDMNSYRTGRIGRHNVVLLLLSGMGKVHAAHAAANLHSSFTRLRLVLLVGGCAAVPRINEADVLLGDVIISTGVIQYDYGRRYPTGFLRKNTAGDNLNKPQKEIRNILAALQAPGIKNKLLERTADLLVCLQKTSAINGYGTRHQYPGVREDKLYEASYRHKHRSPTCATCNEANNTVCDSALQATCEDLGCEKNHLVDRPKLMDKLRLCQNGDIGHQNPNIFFGTVGSADMVMRSGECRDAIAKTENVVAFEMEAAGVWEEIPSLVIKGAFDYGDSHKNKRWQAFASATAASVARAVIEQLPQTDRGEMRAFTHAIEDNLAMFHGKQTNMIEITSKDISGHIRKNRCERNSEQLNVITSIGQLRNYKMVELKQSSTRDCKRPWTKAKIPQLADVEMNSDKKRPNSSKKSQSADLRNAWIQSTAKRRKF